MENIDLVYVGRGMHEELIAHIADQEGYFEDEGVHVAIRDEEAQRYFDRYVRPYFLANRVVDLAAAQQSIDAVATELGVATTRADTFYASAIANS